MPFDAEEAELLSATQSLCRWVSGSDVSSSGTVSALPSTVDSLRSVELFLRRDHPTMQPHHRSLGRWQTAQTALLPLMTTYKRDREVVYPVMKLLVRLTMALPAESETDSRRERTTYQRQLRTAMLEGAHLDVLMQWLTPLLARPPAIRSVDDVNLIELSLTLIKNLLAIAAGSNTQPNAAADETASSTKAEASKSPQSRQVGERIIRRYAECGVLDLLAALCWQPEDLNKFGLLLLETIAHLVGGVSVDELVAEQRRAETEEEARRQKERRPAVASQTRSSTAGHYSYLWKAQSQSSPTTVSAAKPSPSPPASSSPSSLGWQLQTVRLNEKSRYVAPSRHSRFGTLLTLPSPLTSSFDGSSDLSAPPVSSGTQLVRNMFNMHAMGSDNLPSFRGRTPRHINSAAAASASTAAGERGVCSELADFVLQFIGDGCYERLMDSAVKELKANVRVVRDDERHWMSVAALMMGVWREQQMNLIKRHSQQHNSDASNNNSNDHNNDRASTSQPDGSSPPTASSPAPYFRCEPVMSCLSTTAFSLLTSKLLLYIQEKPNPLPFLTASLHLYSEVVHTLSVMLRTASPADREKANQLRHAFYYEKEQLDLLVSLMRQWSAHSWGGPLMALLVDCVHWSMQMLDDVDGTHTVSERRKRRVVKNKTVLVDGAKQKMAIADLQQALPANVILDAAQHNHQMKQQEEQDGSELRQQQQEQSQDEAVMAVAVAEPALPATAAPLSHTNLNTMEHAEQEEATEGGTDDNRQRGILHVEPAHLGEAEVAAVTCESASAELRETDISVADNVDSQAATLPLPADSIDSTADTIHLPDVDVDNHIAAQPAETVESVDSQAVTQQALSVEQQEEAQMTVDSRAQTVILHDDAVQDAMADAVATQPLPADAASHVDIAGEPSVDGGDAQVIGRQPTPPPHTRSPTVDVSRCLAVHAGERDGHSAARRCHGLYGGRRLHHCSRQRRRGGRAAQRGAAHTRDAACCSTNRRTRVRSERRADEVW